MDRVLARELQRRMRVRERLSENTTFGQEPETRDRRTHVEVPPERNEPAATPPAEESAEAPSCRICFGSDQDGHFGRLFSPCLCRGTSSHVHVECLNSWRRLSSNSNSYWRCDQCRFPYKIVKNEKVDKIVRRIQSPGVMISMISTFIIMVSTLLGLLVSFGMGFVQLNPLALYEVLDLIPLWRKKTVFYAGNIYAEFLDKSADISVLYILLDLSFYGISLLGITGFGTVIYYRLTRYPEYFMQVAVPALALSALANGLRFIRIMIFLGVVVAWMKGYNLIWSEIQKWKIKHGEIVLGISERRPRQETASASEDSVHSTVRSFLNWLNDFMGIPQVQLHAARRR